MQSIMNSARASGARERALLLALVVVTCGAIVVLGAGDLDPAVPLPAGRTISMLALASGLVAGAFLVMGAVLSYFNWRLAPELSMGWLVAASVLVSCQSFALGLLMVYRRPLGLVGPEWPLHVVALTSLFAVGLAVLASRPHRVRPVDPLGVGLGIGLVMAVLLLVPSPFDAITPVSRSVLVGVIVATHLLGAALVVRHHVLSRPAALLMAATVLAVGAGHVVDAVGLAGTLLDLLLAIARVAAGATWLVAIHLSLRTAATHEQERSDELEHTLIETVGSERDQRERMHELRSTLAGLVNAAGMLERPEVNDLSRLHLQETIYRELTRMQRLLSDDKGAPTVIALDEALEVMLDLQRLKGRHVELHSSGDCVQAHYDGLAEVVNILLDNAATHGGSDSSVVEVTRCADDTVEIMVTDFGCGIAADDRQRIFAWGERGQDSPGQGIGLHLAQRLVAEDGGSLRYAEPVAGGSSFVISLPSPRQPMRDDQWP